MMSSNLPNLTGVLASGPSVPSSPTAPAVPATDSPRKGKNVSNPTLLQDVVGSSPSGLTKRPPPNPGLEVDTSFGNALSLNTRSACNLSQGSTGSHTGSYTTGCTGSQNRKMSSSMSPKSFLSIGTKKAATPESAKKGRSEKREGSSDNERSCLGISSGSAQAPHQGVIGGSNTNRNTSSTAHRVDPQAQTLNLHTSYRHRLSIKSRLRKGSQDDSFLPTIRERRENSNTESYTPSSRDGKSSIFSSLDDSSVTRDSLCATFDYRDLEIDVYDDEGLSSYTGGKLVKGNSSKTSETMSGHLSSKDGISGDGISGSASASSGVKGLSVKLMNSALYLTEFGALSKPLAILLRNVGIDQPLELQKYIIPVISESLKFKKKKFVVIQGPPESGKTSALIISLLACYAFPDLTCFSNKLGELLDEKKEGGGNDGSRKPEAVVVDHIAGAIANNQVPVNPSSSAVRKSEISNATHPKASSTTNPNGGSTCSTGKEKKRRKEKNAFRNVPYIVQEPEEHLAGSGGLNVLVLTARMDTCRKFCNYAFQNMNLMGNPIGTKMNGFGSGGIASGGNSSKASVSGSVSGARTPSVAMGLGGNYNTNNSSRGNSVRNSRSASINVSWSSYGGGGGSHPNTCGSATWGSSVASGSSHHGERSPQNEGMRDYYIAYCDGSREDNSSWFSTKIHGPYFPRVLYGYPENVLSLLQNNLNNNKKTTSNGHSEGGQHSSGHHQSGTGSNSLHHGAGVHSKNYYLGGHGSTSANSTGGVDLKALEVFVLDDTERIIEMDKMEQVLQILQICKFFSKRKIRFIILSGYTNSISSLGAAGYSYGGGGYSYGGGASGYSSTNGFFSGSLDHYSNQNERSKGEFGGNFWGTREKNGNHEAKDVVTLSSLNGKRDNKKGKENTVLRTLRNSLLRGQNLFGLRKDQIRIRARRLVRHYCVIAPQGKWTNILVGLQRTLNLPLGVIFLDQPDNIIKTQGGKTTGNTGSTVGIFSSGTAVGINMGQDYASDKKILNAAALDALTNTDVPGITTDLDGDIRRSNQFNVSDVLRTSGGSAQRNSGSVKSASDRGGGYDKTSKTSKDSKQSQPVSLVDEVLSAFDIDQVKVRKSQVKRGKQSESKELKGSGGSGSVAKEDSVSDRNEAANAKGEGDTYNTGPSKNENEVFDQMEGSQHGGSSQQVSREASRQVSRQGSQQVSRQGSQQLAQEHGGGSLKGSKQASRESTATSGRRPLPGQSVETNAELMRSNKRSAQRERLKSNFVQQNKPETPHFGGTGSISNSVQAALVEGNATAPSKDPNNAGGDGSSKATPSPTRNSVADLVSLQKMKDDSEQQVDLLDELLQCHQLYIEPSLETTSRVHFYLTPSTPIILRAEIPRHIKCVVHLGVPRTDLQLYGMRLMALDVKDGGKTKASKSTNTHGYGNAGDSNSGNAQNASFSSSTDPKSELCSGDAGMGMVVTSGYSSSGGGTGRVSDDAISIVFVEPHEAQMIKDIENELEISIQVIPNELLPTY